MTIPTPINEVKSPLDINTLAQLANQFFANLPGDEMKSTGQFPNHHLPGSSSLGGVNAPVNVLPAGTSLGPLANGPQLPGTHVSGANIAPQTPNSAVSMVASTPALVPHATAPNGLPDHLASIPPAVDGRLGGAVLGVPQAQGQLSNEFPATIPRGFPDLSDIKTLLSGIDHRQPINATEATVTPVHSTSYYFAAPEQQSPGAVVVCTVASRGLDGVRMRNGWPARRHHGAVCAAAAHPFAHAAGAAQPEPEQCGGGDGVRGLAPAGLCGRGVAAGYGGRV